MNSDGMSDSMPSLVTTSEGDRDDESTESETELAIDRVTLARIVQMCQRRRLSRMRMVFVSWLGVWASGRFGIFGIGRT